VYGYFYEVNSAPILETEVIYDQIYKTYEILHLQLITTINFQVLIHTNPSCHPVWKQIFSLLASTAVYFLQYQINNEIQQLMLHDYCFMNNVFLKNSFVSMA
jgi:hypothetical protein